MSRFQTAVLFFLLSICTSVAARPSRNCSKAAARVSPAERHLISSREFKSGALKAGFSLRGKFQCVPERNFIRDGGTYNDPNATLTESPLHCCRLCFDDPRCKTWSRNRQTGSCALMDIIPPLTPNAVFDSGLLQGVDATSVIAAPKCAVSSGFYFPKGKILERKWARNARRCCERCRDNGECFSWHYHGPTRRCALNADVSKPEAGFSYKGHALI